VFEILKKCRLMTEQQNNEARERLLAVHHEFSKVIQRAVLRAFEAVAAKDKEKLAAMVRIWRESKLFGDEVCAHLLARFEEARAEKAKKALQEREVHGMTLQELQFLNAWVELAEIRAYARDVRAKRQKTEKDLEAKVVNLGAVDEIELECLVEEYKALFEQELEHQKILMN